MIEMIHQQVRVFIQSTESPQIIEKKFHISRAEAQHWIEQQRWNLNLQVSQIGLQNAHEALAKIGIDMSSVFLKDMCAPWVILK
ncbi:MAG: hypothetical protein FJX95_06080 [Bacteroidetes bacterium]|nr:hypothetical protein [Bacteroidota bacterium]